MMKNIIPIPLTPVAMNKNASATSSVLKPEKIMLRRNRMLHDNARHPAVIVADILICLPVMNPMNTPSGNSIIQLVVKEEKNRNTMSPMRTLCHHVNPSNSNSISLMSIFLVSLDFFSVVLMMYNFLSVIPYLARGMRCQIDSIVLTLAFSSSGFM